MPCSPAPFEVAGRFIIVVEEDPARTRRHLGNMVSFRDGFVVYSTLHVEYGSARQRYGLPCVLYTGVSECYFCYTIP